MLKRAFASFPINNKRLIIHGFVSLFLCLFVFPIGLYVHLQADLDRRTDNAVFVLTKKMNDIFIELKQVLDKSAATCTQNDLKRLRRITFYSHTFKELGIFSPDFQVYCTIYGKVNFGIFNSIKKQIKQSPEHRVVSLVRSKILDEKTFSVFYQGANGFGVNGLTPPTDLLKGIAWILQSNYDYNLNINGEVISSYKDMPDKEVLDKRQRSLKGWPITLTVLLPKRLYLSHLYLLIPWAVFSWLLLYIILYFSHFSLIQYRHSLSYGIRKAIEGDEMEVYFQPIVSLYKGDHHKMEALIRWNSPYHGQVSPLSIVEVSGRLGLMDELTWMVMRKVGAFYRQYPEQLSTINTAVNVDRNSLVKDTFVPKLVTIFEEYPELKGRLGLEVTETSVSTKDELPFIVSSFEKIKALDIHLSVDDFGTGYSGLDFLRRFPYDTLKLDQVFITGLRDDPFTGQVLALVTKLAKELHMELVAEGVEREDQLEAVTALGVDRVQGYYFCRPLAQDDVILWLRENPPK